MRHRVRFLALSAVVAALAILTFVAISRTRLAHAAAAPGPRIMRLAPAHSEQAAPGGAVSASTAMKEPLSTRVVAYEIDAKLDAAKAFHHCNRDPYLQKSNRTTAANISLPSLPERIRSEIHFHDGSAPQRHPRHRPRFRLGSKTSRIHQSEQARSGGHGRPDGQNGIHPPGR